jgi:hypothetical protein
MCVARLRAEVLDVIYAVPHELDSLEAHERYNHRDVSRRPQVELTRELERLRLRLLLEDEPDAWLLQRQAKLREVLNRAR